MERMAKKNLNNDAHFYFHHLKSQCIMSRIFWPTTVLHFVPFIDLFFGKSIFFSHKKTEAIYDLPYREKNVFDSHIHIDDDGDDRRKLFNFFSQI